jgi:antitoxin ParD1/3/4
MPTQNVNLTTELELFVKEQVRGGNFNNASEVHRAALAAMRRAEEERLIRLDRLRNEIQKGIDSIDAGDFVEIESEVDEGRFFEKQEAAALARSGSQSSASTAG